MAKKRSPDVVETPVVPKRHSDVVEMMRDVTGDDAYTEQLARHLVDRQIVSRLAALRVARGLSQREIGEKLGCTQGKISKLEASIDAEVSMGDLARYADALGLRVGVTLIKKDATIVDRVKHHAFSIKRLLDILAKLAEGDEVVAKGVARFFGEATVNLVGMVQASAKKLLPRQEDRTLHITLDFCDEDECVVDDDASDDSPEEDASEATESRRALLHA